MTHNQFKKWFESNGFEMKQYEENKDLYFIYLGEKEIAFFNDWVLYTNSELLNTSVEFQDLSHLSKTDDYLTFHFEDKSEYKVWLGEVE